MRKRNVYIIEKNGMLLEDYFGDTLEFDSYDEAIEYVAEEFEIEVNDFENDNVSQLLKEHDIEIVRQY